MDAVTSAAELAGLLALGGTLQGKKRLASVLLDPLQGGSSQRWKDAAASVGAVFLRQGHPCSIFLKSRGIDLSDESGVNSFIGNASPIGGMRWYVSCSVLGASCEFLVDTGASHTMLGKEFHERLVDRPDKSYMEVQASVLTERT